MYSPAVEMSILPESVDLLLIRYFQNVDENGIYNSCLRRVLGEQGVDALAEMLHGDFIKLFGPIFGGHDPTFQEMVRRLLQNTERFIPADHVWALVADEIRSKFRLVTSVNV